MKFYMITTSHLCQRIWFWDEEDFRVAMNYVAVIACITGVCIVAFVLMSNHVHFIVECEGEEAARAFIDRFKGKYGMYFWRRHQIRGLLRYNKVDIRPVPLQGDALERAIAYIQMNPVAAGLCQHASLYPWGSGQIFFNSTPAKGTYVRDLSARQLSAFLHCREKVPGDYLLGDDGVLLPHSYIPVKFVESLFRNVSRYNFFLMHSSKAQARLEKDMAPAFQDQVVMIATKDLCRSLFDKPGPRELSREQMVA